MVPPQLNKRLGFINPGLTLPYIIHEKTAQSIRTEKNHGQSIRSPAKKEQ